MTSPTVPAIPELLLRTADLQWRELSPGTRLAVLKRLATGGAITRIQGAPGAIFPEHTHFGGEEVFVISGDYTDDSGTYGAGSFLSYSANSRHRPHTTQGCELLVIAWEAPPRP